jgi:signal transduction histidine kinase
MPPSAARSLALLNRQFRRLEHLVAQMLDTTRLQLGRISLDCHPVDLCQVTRSAVEFVMAANEATASRIHLEVDRPVIGTWDAARLDQVVTNLLTNAIKYGEGQPIDVVVTEQGGRARVVVRDRGIGIPPEVQERIFNAFERAVPVELYAGLGLGLFITRRIVEMHGGTISVASELGQGAVFTVELPLGGAAST